MQHKQLTSQDDSIRKTIHDVIDDFSDSLQKTKKNSARIDGEIPDISEYIKTFNDIDTSLVEDCFKPNEDPVNYIVRKYGLVSNQVVVKPIDDGITTINIICIILPNSIDKNTLGNIKHDLQTYGYYINRTPTQISNTNYFVTVFEPFTNKKPPRNCS